MRGLRLLLCFAGLATYMLIKHFAALSTPGPTVPSLRQGSSFDNQKLELLEEPDEIA